jgi:MraZ protein
MVFFGAYDRPIDSRGRIELPQPFRDAIGADELRTGLVLTRGFDHCLFLFPVRSWERVLKKLRPLLFGGFDARMLERLLLAEAADVGTDSRGRFAVPPTLLSRAGLADDALLVGAADRIEIWDPTRWSAVSRSVDERYEDLAEAAAARLRRGSDEE